MKPVLVVGAVALVLLGAVVLLRGTRETPPKTGPVAETEPSTSDAGPAPAASPKPPPAPRPAGADAMGIPLDPEAIAQGVAARAKEHAEVLARLRGGQAGDEEKGELKRRASLLATEVGQWAARLSDHKAWQFKELFVGLYRDDPTFKYEAASYLASLPEDRGLDVLLDGLHGSSVHARSAAALALEPHLLRRSDLPDPLRAALRKVLSDDLSSVDTDASTYGPGNDSASDLAAKLRGVAVRLLARAGDVESVPLLLDLETGKDGVGWLSADPKDVDAVYRLLAKHPPLRLAERMEAVVDAHLDAERRPGQEPWGDPIPAALLLAALGRGERLERLRERTYRDFAAQAGRESDALDEAESLLQLRDGRAAVWLLERLTSADGRVRNRALNILRSTTGQALVSSADLLGDGSPEDQARWAQARRTWADWWTAHGQEFKLGNPYR